jgi:septum site-determining protein MinD
MGISLTIAAGKGGTGKTTVSANLGVALAQFDQDVTILDADIAMANLELVLGMTGKETTLHDVLAGDAPIEDAIYEGPGGVKVIPAGVSLSGLKRTNPEKLKDVLGSLIKKEGILIIDVPAGLGKEVYIAMSMGQNLVLVVNPDISSMSDAMKTKIVGERAGIHLLGAVVNRMGHGEFDLTEQEVAEILETEVIGVVPEDPRIKEAAFVGEPLVIRAPDSPAATAIKKLAADLIGERYTPPKAKESLMNRLMAGLGISITRTR